MAIISIPYTFSPNTSISSSAVNANFTEIYNDYNGGITAANLATDSVTTVKIADANVTTAKIADGAVTAVKTSFGAAWASWTPTLSGRFDDADWTKQCYYIQIGKTVICRMRLVATAAAPMGGGTSDAVFTLPVTAATYSPTNAHYPLGPSIVISSGTDYSAVVAISSTTLALIRVFGAGGTYLGVDSISSTAPNTWASGDEVTATFTYEAA